MSSLKRLSGFSLIELLIVLTIMMTIVTLLTITVFIELHLFDSKLFRDAWIFALLAQFWSLT